VLDYHHTWLNLFDEFQATQDKLEAGNFLKLSRVSSPTYYIEAFFDGNLEWTEYAYNERELQDLKDQAISCSFTFTVKEVSDD